jgi:hypothetical protein
MISSSSNVDFEELNCHVTLPATTCEIKQKKCGSGKTFYLETFDQIDHLSNIFDEYFPNSKWRRFFETPSTNHDVFTYFKYMVIVQPNGKRKLAAIIQFPTRKTVNSAKRLFADCFGIFKLFTLKRIKKPLVIAHLKMKVLGEIPSVVLEKERTWNEFSFGGASCSLARKSMKYLRALSIYEHYQSEHFCNDLPGAKELCEYKYKMIKFYESMRKNELSP